MPRLFTALEIPRNAAMSLSLLRGGLPGARWIDVENYHITLRFIGDVDGPHGRRDRRPARPDRPAGIPDQTRRHRRLRLEETAFGLGRRHADAGDVRAAGRNRADLPADRAAAGSAQVHPACDAGTAEILARRGRRAVSRRAWKLPDLAFTVPRFVLLSSRDSVGGGPYLTEEVFPLNEALSAPKRRQQLPAAGQEPGIDGSKPSLPPNRGRGCPRRVPSARSPNRWMLSACGAQCAQRRDIVAVHGNDQVEIVEILGADAPRALARDVDAMALRRLRSSGGPAGRPGASCRCRPNRWRS
jgi:2'-5' RNA ligase